MSDAPRCEPPEGMRDQDGWHWVQQSDFAPTLACWHSSDRVDVEPLWTSVEHVYSATPAYAVREWGWRYIAPVASAAEVEALRVRMEYLEGECNSMNNDIGRLERDNTTLRARVAELEGALHDMLASRPKVTT